MVWELPVSSIEAAQMKLKNKITYFYFRKLIFYFHAMYTYRKEINERKICVCIKYYFDQLQIIKYKFFLITFTFIDKLYWQNKTNQTQLTEHKLKNNDCFA